MADTSIIIIGAGMGGLACGIYGRLNDFQTQIFEMHTQPGGQCTAWKRQGYTFDACIHHLFGCDPSARLYDLWHELGAMPRGLVPTKECTSVASPAGQLFRDYYDLETLKRHLEGMSPRDAKAIDEYVRAIQSVLGRDAMGEMMMGSAGAKLFSLPAMLSSMKWAKTTMQQYGARFSDPFLRRAFPLLEYSLPEVPMIVHLAKYDEEKQKVAQQVIDLLANRWAGIKDQVEVIDVPTLMTWERYMGGSHGFMGMPNKKVNMLASVFGKGWEMTLPGLSHFYMVGQWATSAGALFSNALSGRTAIRTLCKQQGKKFTTQL